MATPVSKEADEARWYFARERRRKLQDLSDFKTAGLIAPSGSPFDFGNTPTPSGLSPLELAVPADVDIALSFTAPLSAGDIGLIDITGAVVYETAENSAANGFVDLRHTFIKLHVIRILRNAGAPAGTLGLYFKGPKSQRTLFGFSTFL